MKNQPPGIVDHYTLFRTATPLEKNRERRNLARSWRNHPIMIIPMDHVSHDLLHDQVQTFDVTPSIYLARHALNHCNQLLEDPMSRVKAFANVRDEMYGMYRRRSHSSVVAREALRFSEFFTRQIEFIKQVPVLDIDYNFAAAHEMEEQEDMQDEGPAGA